MEAASVQRLPKIAVGTAAAMIAAMIGIHLMSQFLRSFFMGSLVVYSRWFAPERFSTLTGMQLAQIDQALSEIENAHRNKTPVRGS